MFHFTEGETEDQGSIHSSHSTGVKEEWTSCLLPPHSPGVSPSLVGQQRKLFWQWRRGGSGKGLAHLVGVAQALRTNVARPAAQGVWPSLGFLVQQRHPCPHPLQPWYLSVEERVTSGGHWNLSSEPGEGCESALYLQRQEQEADVY